MARRRKQGEGSLAVILGEFPSNSETFILREMLELQKRGFDLLPLALDQPEPGSVHSESVDLADVTIYCPRPLSTQSFFAQLSALVHYPVGYASALAFVVHQSLRSPGNIRELAGSLLTAASFAAAIGRRRKIGHIHAQFISRPATVGMLLAEILGLAFSMSGHARDIYTSDSILVGTKLGEAEFTVVCTNHALERLERQHRLMIGGNVHLIHHGIDPERFEPRPDPVERPPLVLSVGRLVPKKGFDILLRAAAVARANGADFRLSIVGDGPERDDLERLATGLGLREVLTFHGRLTQEELLPLYESAHTFALGSVVTEDGDRDGIPNVLLEALAMGVPSVATSTGGIPEIIDHEESGLIAKPGDVTDFAAQLERMIYDEELRERVQVKGRERVLQDFEISRNIDDLVVLLEKYVKPGTVRPSGVEQEHYADVEQT